MLNSVTRPFVYAIVFASVVAVAGCRQADGPLPPATGSVPNELGDISRDIWNLAGGNADGAKDLSDDISHYAEGSSGGQPAARELSNRLATALKGKQFKLAQAMPLAHTCWETVAARQLSEKQVEGLKAEMKSQLMSLGVADPQAQNVADQVGVVQQAVTGRHRRWYELL